MKKEQTRLHKRWICLWMMFLLLFGVAAAEKMNAYPEALRITQSTVTRKLDDCLRDKRTYPQTASDSANRILRDAIDAMADGLAPLVPKSAQIPGFVSYSDVGAVFTRTGTSWSSFLIIGRVVADRMQIAVQSTSYTFDLTTGTRILLSGVFPKGDPIWQRLSDGARAQITAMFPEREPDAAAMDALLSPEALRTADFSLSAGQLRLHFHAGFFYPGVQQILHVIFPYAQVRDAMTEVARAQTDNSRYKMVAVTFDDGPARGYTLSALDALRDAGASASFFILGKRLASNMDVFLRTQDAGHTIGIHGYQHYYTGFSAQELCDQQEQCYQEMEAIIGRRPTLRRAPGGDEPFLQSIGVTDLPFIHWSSSAGDTDSEQTVETIKNIALGLRDGDILLMHDIKEQTDRNARAVLDVLTRRGFLCVTIEELFARDGVTLEPNGVYWFCRDGVTVP